MEGCYPEVSDTLAYGTLSEAQAVARLYLETHQSQCDGRKPDPTPDCASKPFDFQSSHDWKPVGDSHVCAQCGTKKIWVDNSSDYHWIIPDGEDDVVRCERCECVCKRTAAGWECLACGLYHQIRDFGTEISIVPGETIITGSASSENEELALALKVIESFRSYHEHEANRLRIYDSAESEKYTGTARAFGDALESVKMGVAQMRGEV